MDETFERHTYHRDDLLHAAEVLDSLYGYEDIEPIVNMLKEIANGMDSDDGIITDGETTNYGHGV